MLIVHRHAELDLCLGVSEAIFSLLTQNQTAHCVVIAGPNESTIVKDKKYELLGRNNDFRIFRRMPYENIYRGE